MLILSFIAKFLQCKVVSPLWVKECDRFKKLIPEGGYLVDTDYLLASATRKSAAPAKLKEGSKKAVLGALKKRPSHDSTSSEEMEDNDNDDESLSRSAAASILSSLSARKMMSPRRPAAVKPVDYEEEEEAPIVIPVPIVEKASTATASGSNSSCSSRYSARVANISGIESASASDLDFVRSIGPDTLFRLVNDESELRNGIVAKKTSSKRKAEPSTIVNEKSKLKRSKPEDTTSVETSSTNKKPTKKKAKAAESKETASDHYMTKRKAGEPMKVVLSGFSGDDALMLESLMTPAANCPPSLVSVSDPLLPFDVVVAEQAKRYLYNALFLLFSSFQSSLFIYTYPGGPLR